MLHCYVSCTTLKIMHHHSTAITIFSTFWAFIVMYLLYVQLMHNVTWFSVSSRPSSREQPNMRHLLCALPVCTVGTAAEATS